MAEHNTGFINHACVAFTKDASRFTGIEYTKSRLERIGETLIWHVSELPRAITTFFSDPKVATIALTTLAMFAVQFCFYPTMTYLWVKNVVVFLSHYIQPWAVRFAFYIATQAAVLGVGVRTLGRFTNQSFMKAWYGQQRPNGSAVALFQPYRA